MSQGARDRRTQMLFPMPIRSIKRPRKQQLGADTWAVKVSSTYLIFWGSMILCTIVAWSLFRYAQQSESKRESRMPGLLGWLMVMCFAFVLLLPLSLIGGHSINGVQVTREEFWRRGGGPLFAIAGALFPVCGYGIMRAQNWSRYLFVGLHLASLVGSLFVGGGANTVWGLGSVTFFTYYLFWRSNVREYFGSQS